MGVADGYCQGSLIVIYTTTFDNEFNSYTESRSFYNHMTRYKERIYTINLFLTILAIPTNL